MYQVASSTSSRK
uniref:Uncharacterized protein n=1 Tax=Arundo donax TaxID=35708 RepID=A0A0A9CAY1_ARUDO